jgi:catechol 2,3-dioxygenase-like lactoylglutathione lyase family enzyme
MSEAVSMVSGVSHIMLGVSDLTRSAAFDENTLGRPIRFRIEEFAFVDGGPIMIGLTTALAKNRASLPGAVEIVLGVDAVKPVWRELKERGVAFLTDPRQLTPNEWGATFTDPDGHCLTIFGPPGE